MQGGSITTCTHREAYKGMCGTNFMGQKCFFFMDLDTSERLGIKNRVDGSTALVYKNFSALVKANILTKLNIG
jgi:hypothetical protein